MPFPPLGNSAAISVSINFPINPNQNATFHRIAYSYSRAAEVHGNDFFFCLYQQNKFSESKVKFRQDSISCKRVLEATKVHMLLKQKSPSFPRNLTLWTFGEMLIVFSTKVNLLYLLYSTVEKCCLLHLIKQNYLLKTKELYS